MKTGLGNSKAVDGFINVKAKIDYMYLC